MSLTDVSTAPARSSGFLDIKPMISALQFQPTDFELSRGWLKHVPSRHQFKFGHKGQVTIDARCECSGHSIRREQKEQFSEAFTAWCQSYWQPLQLDQEFASHFRKPSSFVRFVRDAAWRRFRRRAEPVTVPAEALAMIPAE